MPGVTLLLGFAIGAPVGWAARSLISALEATGHLPSIEEAFAVLDPLWTAWDAA